jgi:hypothetical protein
LKENDGKINSIIRSILSFDWSSSSFISFRHINTHHSI